MSHRFYKSNLSGIASLRYLHAIKLFALALSCVSAVTLFRVLPARADCVYQGTVYQTGDTNPEGQVCTPNGTWQ